MRKNREALEAYEAKFKIKEDILKKKKKTLIELEKQYRQKCEETGEKPLTFEDFKDKKKEKKRDDESVGKPKMKKTPQSVR